MPIIIKSCGGESVIPDYTCDPCGETEGGRVRGGGFIHHSLKAEITKENVALQTWWEKHIEAGLIRIIPETRGTFDGGTPITVTGFGNEDEKKTGKTFVAVISDKNHAGNVDFYESLETNFKYWIPMFKTEKELRIGTDVMTAFDAADQVEEDKNSTVLWQATLTWDQKAPKYLVPVYTIPDEIQEYFNSCIEVEAE